MGNSEDNEMVREPRTTLTIKDRTLERYKRYGEFGESWDNVFNKVMDLLEECKKAGKK